MPLLCHRFPCHHSHASELRRKPKEARQQRQCAHQDDTLPPALPVYFMPTCFSNRLSDHCRNAWPPKPCTRARLSSLFKSSSYVQWVGERRLVSACDTGAVNLWDWRGDGTVEQTGEFMEHDDMVCPPLAVGICICICISRTPGNGHLTHSHAM